VHPFRVGLPTGLYASAADPVPALDTPPPVPTAAALELPTEPTDLEGWLVATLRVAPPERMASALARAEATACERFPTKTVVAAMRRVLTVELAHGG
jgi:hypothetical protein